MTNLNHNIGDIHSQTYEYRSDHFLLDFDLNILNNRIKPTPRTVYNFRRAKMDRVKRDIRNIHLHDNDTVNQLWNTFKDKTISILDRHIPKIKVKNKHSPPWIDEEVIHTSKAKDTKYKKAKTSKTQADWDDYKTTRNRLKNLVNTKYKSYIRNVGLDLYNNPKKFWSLLNNRTKSKGSPERIVHNNQEVTDPIGKATAINEYLCSIFTTWGTKHFPETATVYNPNLSRLSVTELEVEKALNQLNPTKAPGPDGIPTKILKDCAREVAPNLTMIFNKSLQTGCLPREWKDANVVPIYKKGKHTDPSNYRPISLLPVCSKVLERLIYNKIIDEIRPNISKFQHGFLANSSTNTQLLSFFSDITDILDNKGESDIIYFDLSKAFDSVPHPPTLAKLKSFGINDMLFTWFSDYLSNRRQRVVIDGKTSGWLPVTSGVPQGSILGPLMFLLYINDLPDVISEDTLCGIFADDTKIARHIQNEEDKQHLQRDIDALKRWGDSWGLSFNPKKCKHLRVSTNLLDNLSPYNLDGTELETVDKMTDLGITVSSDLKWTDHINTMCRKAEGRLWMVIRTLGFYSSVPAKKTAYIALIRSVLEYGSPIWNPRYKNQQKTIEDIQRKGTNYILNNERYDHPEHINYKTRLQILDLLPTTYRREIHDITLMLKSINGNTNMKLKDNIRYIDRPTGPRTRQQTHGTKLFTFTTNLDRSRHFFTHRVIDTWNALPDSIRLALRNTDNTLVIKQHLIPYYKQRLTNVFDPYNQCTWSSICKCNRCS
jgi:hypothetical protein